MADWDFDGGRIASGATVTWAFWWEDGGVRPYKGIQVCHARPEPVRGGGLEIWHDSELRVTELGLRISSVPRGYVYTATVHHAGGVDDLSYTMIGERVD